jgi:hypothetical protein
LHGKSGRYSENITGIQPFKAPGLSVRKSKRPAFRLCPEPHLGKFGIQAYLNRKTDNPAFTGLLSVAEEEGLRDIIPWPGGCHSKK